MQPPLIHIGYHKTGSTWLQKEIFDNPDFGFAALEDSSNKSSIIKTKSLSPVIYKRHDLDFDANDIQSYIDQNSYIKDHSYPVISDERLSGSPHFGGRDNAMIAKRISQIFPHSKILICVREQRAAILSCYYQYLKRGGGKSLRHYMCEHDDPRGNFFDQRHFHYDRLIAHYISLFGDKNVCVLAYEDLRDNPHGFVKTILDFCDLGHIDCRPHDTSHNSTPSYIGASFTRLLGPLCARDAINDFSPLALPLPASFGKAMLKFMRRPFDFIMPQSWEMSFYQSQYNKVHDALDITELRASNQRLQTYVSSDMSAYNYVLS